jgi:uncharacterized membrane protein YqjE
MSDRDAGGSGSAADESLASGLKGWLFDGVQLLRVRLELLGVEAREHAFTVVELLLLGLAAVILLGLGMGFLAVLLTVLLWDGHRTLALALFTAFFLTLGAVALVWAVVRWRRSQHWFEASLQELRRDEQQLRP